MSVLQPQGTASCTGADTVSIDACAQADFEAADVELNRYYRAALQRLRSEKEDKAAEALVTAQRAWIRYRDAECSAVYENWSGGSIRTLMYLDCRTGLTKARTEAIWSHWLTYMDSTPPILPRPGGSARADER